MPYYNEDGKLPEMILVDVRHTSADLSVKSFSTEKSFFDFLHKNVDAENVRVEHIWKYRAGGRLKEQEVKFFGKLQLVPVQDADMCAEAPL